MILWHVSLKGKIEVKGTRASTRYNSDYSITYCLHEKSVKQNNKKMIVQAIHRLAKTMAYGFKGDMLKM